MKHLSSWRWAGLSLALAACAPEDPGDVVLDSGVGTLDVTMDRGDVVLPERALDVLGGDGRDGAPGACTTAGDCPAGSVCSSGMCQRDLGPCTSSDECRDDSRCARGLGRCVPFLPGEREEPCEREARAGVFAPAVQCRFAEAPMGDRFPTHLHVLSTPMVADFRIGRAPDEPARPSIVAVFDDGDDGGSENPTGLVRILDGRTCALQYNLDAQLVSHSSPLALGDLDGDGRAEIVAFKAGGGLVAFRFVPEGTGGAWTVLWRSTRAGAAFNPTGGGWGGPSIADLDDDGRPEVFRHGMVFNGQTGVYVGGAGVSAQLQGYSAGGFTVVLDVDDDRRPELVTGQGVYAWDPARAEWEREAYYVRSGCTGGGCGEGHTAVAELGMYPTGRGAGAPEIAVASAGFVRIDTLEGRTVFGPVALPGGGTGGAPTVADFDGDGLPEVAAAGATAYTVFDPDCGMSSMARPGGRCGTGATNGVLWSRPSQDSSSNVTGSTSFDFEGDGRVEAVYADECFARVYDGATGEVLFSQHHSSCTWYENPVVADVDGDFRAELVVGSNFNCGNAMSGIACPGVGPRGVDVLFPGIRCALDADCPSGSCALGFCRCTMDAQCCPTGAAGAECTYVCAAPPAGTPGSGNTCRASRPRGVRGLRVYNDVADRWVRSRMVWNQHPYNVTNIGDDLRVPRTSAVLPNWRERGLNNFRTNVQGTAQPTASPDATAGGGRVECLPEGAARLFARVCNRGSAPIADGLPVTFAAGAGTLGSTPLCRLTTARVLAPGECLELTCLWATPTAGATVFVTADDGRSTTECREGNNLGLITAVECRQPG